MKVKKVTIRDLLIAKGINPETADFKDIFGILDVKNDTEQASTIAKLKADNAKLRETLDFECDGRCNAEYSPCNAREVLQTLEETK